MKFKPIHISLKDNSSVLIREGTVDDAEALIPTMKDILRETEYLLLEEEEFNMTLEEEKNWLKRFDFSPNSLYLVAVHNDKIIGTMGIEGNNMLKVKHTASIGISLRKEWQGLGLGRKLMEVAINWAKNNTGLELIWLEVLSPNTHAIKLYEKLGFMEAGRQKDFFKLPQDRYCDNIIMNLKLK